MERLTNPSEPFKVPCRVSQCYIVMRYYDRLAEYEDAEEQGRLVVFPETLSTSRINYIKEIIAKQIEYAAAETELNERSTTP